MVWWGLARLGEAVMVRLSALGQGQAWPGSWGRASHGSARRGMAVLARRAKARSGGVCRGLAVMIRRGLARRGVLRLGEAC